VVTSPQAAAWRDILHVLERRYPLVEVILAPALVQGPEAPRQIADGIRALNEETEVDLIIVARGGGSLEELWAFNEEVVARAIYDSRVPVISGVGHEIDFTIADFVADLRAPTPTAAAAAAVPDAQEYKATLQRQRGRLVESIERQIAGVKDDLRYAKETIFRLSPRAVLERYRLRVDDLGRQALSQVEQKIRLQRERVRSRTLQLATLNPKATLERGYSITRKVDTGVVVKSVAQVAKGDRIGVQVTDGQFEGTVE
jgi:exodeoxyribonuclease VII large subunit